jgi:DNA polymerase III alpha subunit
MVEIVAFVAPMNSNTARYSEKWVKFWFTQRRTRCAGKTHPIDNSVVALVQKYGDARKYPNQRSMHSCGILISEEPITNYTVLEMPQRLSPCIV